MAEWAPCAGPKVVFLVGDGGDNASTATDEEVVALAITNIIPIFNIGIGDFAGPRRSVAMDPLAGFEL